MAGWSPFQVFRNCGRGSLLALGLAIAVLSTVFFIGGRVHPAGAGGPWQSATCAPSPCSDPRDVALSWPGSGQTGAYALAYLLGGADRRLWRSEDGGQNFRDVQAYLDRDLASISLVRAAGAPTFTIYAAVSGTAEILRSRDEGATFDSWPLPLPMEGGPVCGLGPDEAVVLGNSPIAGPIVQWSQFERGADGLNTLGGLRRDCDIVRDPNGNVIAVSVGNGRDIMTFAIDPNRPAPSRLVVTNTQAPPAWQLDDIDCESYAADEIIMGVGRREAAANRPAVCRAAGKDIDDLGLLLSAPYPFTTWTTVFTTERPLISVSFFDVFGATLGDDGTVHTTTDGGNTWSKWTSPTGSIPRKVLVLPRRTDLDNYPRVVMLSPTGIWFRELLSLPNLAINKEGPAQVIVGGEVTYTLRITNTGGLANNVTVSDTVSADHGVVQALPAPSGRSGQTTLWSLGSLAPGETRTISYTVLLTDDLQVGGLVINRAEVAASADSNAADNTAVVTATVQGGGGGGAGKADMEATKAGPPAVVAGQPFTYTLMASNLGTEKATSVIFTDTLPPELRFLSADFPVAAVLTPAIRWQAGEVDPGTIARISVQVELRGSVAAGTVITNLISVSSANDSNLANNSGSFTSTVATVAPAPSPAQTVSGTIGALGGTLSSQEGSYVVIVPRRAFSSPLSLNFTLAAPPPATGGSIPLAAFALSGTLGTALVETLDRPITVEVKYSDAGLTPEQERKLKLYRKTTSGGFVELSTQVDTANNIARATLDHLSEFVLQVLERFSVYLPFLARGWAGGW
ncbi:MAG: hypothetical protein Q8O86_13155 [Dehalococcoidia bacterium]|nr:hypothetical protein [Dehalococcoidia bacterium]